jgi:hypothetical protein
MCAVVTPVIVVALTTDSDVSGVPPIVTVAPGWKFDPVTVTAVPPATGPFAGMTPAIVGAGPAPRMSR